MGFSKVLRAEGVRTGVGRAGRDNGERYRCRRSTSTLGGCGDALGLAGRRATACGDDAKWADKAVIELVGGASGVINPL